MHKTIIPLLLSVALCAFLPPRRITVWLVGDSTMANKEVRAFPETGWGMPFSHFFDSTVSVDNRAKNGRSTKSFIEEKLWQPIVDGMAEGDYVFVQFGHNDEVKEKTGRYTTLDEFKANLSRYVNETREKKAIPVLITPVARRAFDAAGNVRETHTAYADAVREVAARLQVPLIDLDQEGMALLQQMGPVNSKWLYDYVEPGEHPNYPEGKQDDTHFSELGARKIAEIVLKDVRSLRLELAQHIYVPKAK